MQFILIDDSVVIHYPYPLKPQKSQKGKKRERLAWRADSISVHTTRNGVGVVGALIKKKKRHAL